MINTIGTMLELFSISITGTLLLGIALLFAMAMVKSVISASR